MLARHSILRQGLECGSPLPPFAAIPVESGKVRCQRNAPAARMFLFDEEWLSRLSARAERRALPGASTTSKPIELIHDSQRPG